MMGHSHDHDHSHGHSHDHATSVDHETFCSTLLVNATCNLMEQCVELLKGDDGHHHDHDTQEAPPMWQVWTLGLSLLTIISGSAACGVLVLPCLSQRVYSKVLTFFVALGVGSLSGSAVFHLLPEAFGLHGDPGFMPKACMVIAGIYLFFTVDKFLNLVMDCRKKNKKVADGSAALTESPSLDVEQSSNHTHNHNHGHSHGQGGSSIASVAWLVIFSDGLHNFIDGLAIGVALKKDIMAGVSLSVAVLCEEFPHELGDCAILISSGMSYKQAFAYNLLSAATCFLGFVFGVCIGDLDRKSVLAVAGGMFLYISLCSMLSDMNEKCEEAMERGMRKGITTLALQFTGLFSGLFLMYALQQFGGHSH
uniref:Zinc transporter ZIP8 n=1 Tax=Steinernema glaseri TaxID=37863 RepID=A0A1I7XYZ1_9BILA